MKLPDKSTRMVFDSPKLSAKLSVFDWTQYL
jgi:hypothetical protein